MIGLRRLRICLFIYVFNYLFSGNNEVCGVGLLARGDLPSFQWLVDTFQEENDCWTKTNAIMMDKDIVERKILRKNFPRATLQLCKFHVLKAFK